MTRARLLGAVLVLLVSGCETDPYCITCGDAGPADATARADAMFRDVGPPGDSGVDGGGDAGPPCLTEELCNGEDDDCDGMADEGIDTMRDPINCGGCGNACVPAHAFAECADGVCGIGSCDVGWVDLDGNYDNGCECRQTLPDDTICDLIDNDCDGTIDEEFDLRSDINNCGDCSRVCAFRHAGQSCVAGVCVLGMCDPGWHDIDGDDRNGCEYACTPAMDPDEVCNLVDDDCDGTIDEGDPGGGLACGSTVGTCMAGTTACVGGTVQCMGEVRPTAESCNGLDDDCDATTDEGNPDGARLCGSSVGVCTRGRQSCMGGALVCMGGTMPGTETCDGLDEDCDGSTDEGNPGGGGACGSTTGSCTAGARMCLAGGFVCVGGTSPSPETCDGTDEDCDGSTDEGNPGGGRLCGSGVGACTQGRDACVGGALVCMGGTGPGVETCNGIDDDCDGTIDEGNPDGGAPCGSDVGACMRGAMACVGGGLLCMGGTTPTTETCDGTDQDCDGSVDEGDPGGGGSCGTDVGTCVPGTLSCTGGALVCMGAIGPASELCDGLDQDCDGSTDEGNPGGGGNCGTNVGRCTFGSLSCTGGALVCMGGTGPVLETCNSADDDCDGMVDEAFDLMSDINNCGSCGNVCSFPNAVAQCSGGGCVLAGCLPGFHDIDGLASNGCEYSCSFAGAEVCNGVDDDCDGPTDEGLTPPATFCNPNGVCAGTSATCAGMMGWVCMYPGTFETPEVTCDTLDNDCDGSTDEAFPLIGTSCTNGEIGACLRNGTFVCNAMMDGVTCNAPASGGGVPETCEGTDQDCDGNVDEGLTATTIPTVGVPRSGGGTVFVMQYEASRPDASATGAGTLSTHACSNPNVEPWTTVTWDEARAACCGLNAGGTCPGGGSGWRLCDAADWETACEGPAGTCGWSYASMCSMSQPTTCNGDEYDCDSGTPGDQDCLFTTGSPTFPMCRTDWGAPGSIFDMSGNAREWTNTAVVPNIYEVRGGAYTNLEIGRRCDFDFAVIPRTFNHPNTGFRCCFY